MRPAHYNTKHRDDLTPREKDVLALVSKGKTNAQIADSLGLSLDTVKTHVSNVLGKLDVDSREQAAACWRQNSLGGRLTRTWSAMIGVATSKAAIGSAAGLGVVAAVFVAVFLLGRGEEPPTEAEPICSDLRVPAGGGSQIGARVCEPGDESENLTPMILVYDCRDPLHSWDFEREAARAGFLVLVPELYTPAEQALCGSLGYGHADFPLPGDAVRARLAYAYGYIARHARAGIAPVLVTRGDGSDLTPSLGVPQGVQVAFSPPVPGGPPFGTVAKSDARSILVFGSDRGPYPAAGSKALVDGAVAAGVYAEYDYYPETDGLWRKEDAPGAWETALAFIKRELVITRDPPAGPLPLALPAAAESVRCWAPSVFHDQLGWLPARGCGLGDVGPGLLLMYGCDEIPFAWDFEVAAARHGFHVLVVDTHLTSPPPGGRCDGPTLSLWGLRATHVMAADVLEARDPVMHAAGVIDVPRNIIARGQGATFFLAMPPSSPSGRGPLVLLSPEYPRGEVSPEFPNGYRIVDTSRPTLVMVDGTASPERVAQAEMVVADIRAGGGSATLELVPGADANWTNTASQAALQRALDFLKTGEFPR